VLLTVAVLATAGWSIVHYQVLDRLSHLGSNHIEGMAKPVEPIGTTFTVTGRNTRPPLNFTAQEPVPTRSNTRGVRVAPGHQLLAVPMTIRNGGDVPWISQPSTSMLLWDDHDVMHRLDATFKKVSAGRVLPVVVRLGAGRTTRGVMVFDVPRGTTPERLELTVGPGLPKTVSWTLG
jgi:hypothetical protein